MTSEKPTSEARVLKVATLLLAWLTLPVLGLLLLFITYSSSTLNSSMIPDGQNGDPTILALNGLLGVMLVLLFLIVTYRLKRIYYFHHLRVGLYIGLVIYFLIMASGVIQSFKSTAPQVSTDKCTSRSQQYSTGSAAAVPIVTDKGQGTGFAVSRGDLIVTAYHVIEGAGEVYGNFTSGRINLEVLEVAPQYDLALLKSPSPMSSFFTLSETYSVTDEVYVYGWPGNALHAGPASLSTGIVSRVINTESLQLNSSEAPDGLEMIQTDAAINPGNSGGPLIGACGVIGVVSSTSDTGRLHDYIGAVSEQNIGFAVSSKTVIQAFPSYF